MSSKKGDFIDQMVCDSQFHPGDDKNMIEKCDDKGVIRSLQRNGVCFTYFHKKAKTEKKRDTRPCRMLGTCSQSFKYD